MKVSLVFIRLASLLCLLACASLAVSQEVRMTRSSASDLRKVAEAAAEEQGIALFPTVSDGMPGTQVHLAFNPRSAAVILTSTSPAEVLLENAKEVAERMGLTEADFEWRKGSFIGTVWIDLSDYLEITGARTSFEIPLDHLLHALNESSLEKPLMLCVHTRYGQEVELYVDDSPEKLAGRVFFSPKGDHANMILRYAEDLRWYAYVPLFFFLALLILPIATSVFLVRTLRRRNDEMKASMQPKEFGSGSFLFGGVVAVAVLVLPLILKSPPVEHAMDQAMCLIPFDFSFAYILPGALVLFGIMAIVTTISVRKLRRESIVAMPAEVIPQADDEGDPVRLMPLLLLVPMLLMLGGGTLLFWTNIPRSFAPYILFLPAALVVIGGIVLFSWRHFSRRSVLDPGHPAARAARELSIQAGAPLKRIFAFRTSEIGLNYWPNGTLTMTTRVLRDFEIDEIRALLAVEFSRSKLGDPLWKSGLKVGAVVILITLLFFVPDVLGINKDSFVAGVPIVLFVLGTAWARFRAMPDAELRQARIDTLALQMTQNREAFVKAILKQSQIGFTPNAEVPIKGSIDDAPEGVRRRIQFIMES